MTMHHIICHSLHMYLYKIQTHQLLSGDAIHACWNFANVMLQLWMRMKSILEMWFSDEAHFHLYGFVNKQKRCVWGTENPRVAVLSFLHSPKLMVWAMVSSKGIIGPFIQEQMLNAALCLEILGESWTIHNVLEDRSDAA